MIKFILLFLLSACSNYPTTPDSPQCSPIFKYETSLENIEYISTVDSYCICRMYHFGIDYVGPVKNTSTWKEPIKSCDKLVGWVPDDYAKKAVFWEAVRSKIENGNNEND